MGRQPGTSTPRSRGAYGSTRGKERQRRKRDSRAQQYRNQQAAAEVARHQKELDELIEFQKLNPGTGAAEGARIQAEIDARHKQRMADIELQANQIQGEDDTTEDLTEGLIEVVRPVRTMKQKAKLDRKTLKKESDPKFQFAVTTARMMMKAGYNVKYVIEFTGVGYGELNDFPIDDEGYAIVPQEEEEDESDSSDE
jgi:hypothetical protein